MVPTGSPAPRVVIPVAAPQGRHRDNRFRIDCGVLRQIGIDSLHRQVKLMVIIKRFPYRILLTEHFPCKAFTQENNILLHQVLFGIPVQDIDAHGTEEQRIGCNLPVIKTHASIVRGADTIDVLKLTADSTSLGKFSRMAPATGPQFHS